MPETPKHDGPEAPRRTAEQSASEHVGEAHELLTRLRQKVHDHPELDAAIERLELALAVLNVNTGGML
jgi:hypothetical protein